MKDPCIACVTAWIPRGVPAGVMLHSSVDIPVCRWARVFLLSRAECFLFKTVGVADLLTRNIKKNSNASTNRNDSMIVMNFTNIVF